MAALSVLLYLVAVVVFPTTLLSVSGLVRMSLNVDWEIFHHLTQHHRKVAGHMAQGLGDKALTNLSS